jgi:predicted dinucleotide-binding enzyme
MRIGILGTGMVGRIHAERLNSLRHDVMIGTQDPLKTLARTEKDAMGHPPYTEWQKDHPAVKLGTMAGAAMHGELVINALSGAACLSALTRVADELTG